MKECMNSWSCISCWHCKVNQRIQWQNQLKHELYAVYIWKLFQAKHQFLERELTEGDIYYFPRLASDRVRNAFLILKLQSLAQDLIPCFKILRQMTHNSQIFKIMEKLCSKNKLQTELSTLNVTPFFNKKSKFPLLK